MEPRFELNYCLTKQHYVEFYKQHDFGKRLAAVIILGSIGAYFLFRGIWLQSLPHVFCGLFELLLALWIFLWPERTASKAKKKDMAFEGAHAFSCRTIFTDEAIIDETPNLKLTTHYDRIKRIYISQNVIAMVDDRKMATIMDKNGFSVGNYEEFLRFIQEKCPQLKLPKW